jgi:D-sedoheptulose 7-phosphate isomerase
MNPRDAGAAFAQQYLDGVCGVLRELPLGEIARMLEVLDGAWRDRRQIFVAGNGGSAATASHMANDLAKTVTGGDPSRRGFRAIALTDNVPLLMAWANDVGFEEVFVGQLRPLAQRGDVLIVLSGSGHSTNVVRAVEWARAQGLTTIGLLGRDGGALAPLVDLAVIVPADAYGPIEDAHLVLNHLIMTYFQAQIAATAPAGAGVAREAR